MTTRAMMATCLAALGLAAGPGGRPVAAQERPKLPADVDLAFLNDLANHVVKPAPAVPDRKTGFYSGAKNETALIRKLTSINGRSIADLETDMRPGAKGELGSTAGFLGKDEQLLDVLAADNDYVLGTLGLSHQLLAKHLHAIGAIGLWLDRGDGKKVEFVYHGRRYRVETIRTKGTQPSPFNDGTESGDNVKVENLDTGAKLEYALLVPYMIDRYGFYEGKGTSYRVDPKQVVELFDFLKKVPKKK